MQADKYKYVYDFYFLSLITNQKGKQIQWTTGQFANCTTDVQLHATEVNQLAEIIHNLSANNILSYFSDTDNFKIGHYQAIPIWLLI